MTGQESTPIRVLHVDDDPEFADLVKLYLQRNHDALTVTTANSGPDALARFGNETFDCIVSDYNMPQMDGLELLDAVRDNYPDLPFILFTGRGSEEIASEAISAGVTDYLQKETGTDQYTVLTNRIVNAVESYRSQQALAESKQRYQSLIEKSHDAVFIIQDEQFKFINERICEITGYDKPELKELTYDEILHPDDRERVSKIRTQRKNGQDPPETYEVQIETKSGESRYCDLKVQTITHEGEDAVLGFARDISDQKEYETILKTLHETTRELMRAETKSEICDIAVETTRTELGLPISGVWLYNEDSNCLEPAVSTGEGTSLIGSLPTFQPGSSLAWTVFDAQETTVFDDVQDAEPVHNPETVIQSEAIAPLGRQGILLSGSTETNAFDDFDREVLELLATNTEAALERADREETHRRLTQELKQSKKKIEQLHKIATEMEACESEQEICDLTVDAAERILAFDICIVDIEEDGLLETRSLSSGVSKEETPAMSVNEGLAGKTYRTQESYLFDDIQAVPEAKPQADYHSIISVAIGDHGVFQAVADETGFFGEQDVELAELLLSHTAEALSRVTREQQLRERESSLRKQRDRLEEFSSVVSHDLRNPLNVAQGNLDMVVEKVESSEKQKERVAIDRLKTVETALNRMETIIEDVLALARQGQLSDTPEPVHLDELAERAWTNVETVDATLKLQCNRQLKADVGRLQQLFENLFRNAVEHGGPDVEVQVRTTDDGFTIEDNGCGIPNIESKDIFSSEFSTADDGTGLGLAIVDQIVQAHGWTATATEGRDGGVKIVVSDVTG
ncbi:hybrid sensor histidine kinase/response regulator [Halorussus salinisoli]|uniref:hybrid sensor histidine kinase/response regulator n=1 Tax=Halorussus salinisoli TaxID=2558242 RepID=UPI0010C23C62|nr:GAF domain-containing protein [Halorussus salinisoli]